MREILFRGKRIDKDEMVFGDLVNGVQEQRGLCFIWTDDPDAPLGSFEYGVKPDTIGQFTGLTDKNGKKIFEGDIVKVYEDVDYRIGVHKTNRKTRTIIGVVVFDEKRYEYKIKNEEYNLTLFRLSKKDTNEIIGNIHDNPELLEG